MKKYFYLSIFTVAVFLVFTSFSLIFFNDGKLHIYVCDVGQGDGILIRTPKGEDILIDGGPDDSILACLSSHLPFWDRSIEAVILTHPHADHLTGLIEVLKRYKVIGFWTEKVGSKSLVYQKLLSDLAEKGLTAKYLYQGDSFVEGDGVKLSILWPRLEVVQEVENSTSNYDLDLNGLSVISLLEYKSFKMLFTGDAGEATENKIESLAGNIDVLKVPHHGSSTGMNQEFLDKINSHLAVISVGAKNKYKHPAPVILDLLNKSGIKTLRTDQNGTIEIYSDGNSFSYKSEQ